MISEITIPNSPAMALEQAKKFFSDRNAVYEASLEEESDSHLTFATFRSRVAIAVFKDPETSQTRVRISTLRPNDAVGKLLAYLSSEPATATSSADQAAPPSR